MTRLEVCPLETDGYAIVTVEHAEELHAEYAPYIQLEETTTWRQFRTARHPFEFATEFLDNRIGIDPADYIAAVETANGVDAGDATLEDRWDRITGLAAGPGPDPDITSGDEVFEYEHGDAGAAFEWSMMLQVTMLGDVPWEVIEEFDLVYDSTLDDMLGMVPADILDVVQARLIELGFEFA
jgi:hypothetical protein